MSLNSGITEGNSIIKAGKLIKVHAKFQDSIIIKIKITGDFFIYPEDSIENLEKKLIGKSVEKCFEIIEKILQGCEFIGIDAQSLYKAVIEAWKKRR